jgi:hypothetical protein
MHKHDNGNTARLAITQVLDSVERVREGLAPELGSLSDSWSIETQVSRGYYRQIVADATDKVDIPIFLR